MKTLLLLSSLVFVANLFAQCSGWVYQCQSCWKYEYPACDGNKQGKAPTARLDSASPQLTITVNGATYAFDSLYFHWGARDANGSEHYLLQKFGAMEVAFFHYNTKYANISVALEEIDGIVGIALLLRAQNSSVPKLKPITDALPQITRSRAETSIGLKFGDLIPSTIQKDYYSYAGSLTSPPCTETVTFKVLAELQPIGTDQISEFRKLLDRNNNPITSNVRDRQPLNGRRVERPSDARHPPN